MPPGAPATPDGPPEKRELLVSIAIFAVALSAYLTFVSAHYSYDAVAGGVLLYQWLTQGRIDQLFQRYHVLYLPTAAILEWAAGRIGLDLDPLTLLQAISALFSAASLALYGRLARALGLSMPWSLLGTALFASAFSYWYYATDGESYPLSIFFLLLALLSAARLRPDASWPRALAPGAWLGVAMGFHGTCGLALPALIVLAGPNTLTRVSIRRAAVVACGFALVVAAIYGARGIVVGRGPASTSLAADASAFAAEEGWSFPPELGGEWRGLVRSAVPRDWPALPSHLPGLGKAAAFGWFAAMLLPLGLPFSIDAAKRRCALALALWFGAAFVFFSSYFPGSPKFASYQWAPLILLIGLGAQQAARQRGFARAAGGILILLAAATFACSLDLARRMADPASNPYLVRARAIGKLTQPGDLIVHPGRGDDRYQNVYIPYFAARRSMSLEQYFTGAPGDASRALAAIDARIASEVGRSRRVIVLGDLLEPGAARRELESARGLPEGALRNLFASHAPQAVGTDPGVGRVWMLTR